MLQAVVFDLDGVLLDSEQLWDASRRAVTAAFGGTWRDDATTAMQGMSSPEWSAYLHGELGLGLPEARIVELVVADLLSRYEDALPLMPDATDALHRLGAQWPLALASSSNRAVIEHVLDLAGWRDLFDVTVSSEEVERGKPSPDVYVAAARGLGVPPSACAAVEDSASGIRSALAAHLHVAVVPNPHFPPPSDLLAQVGLVAARLDELTVERLGQLGATDEMLDEEELESFPASDPHSDWAGEDA